MRSLRRHIINRFLDPLSLLSLRILMRVIIAKGSLNL